MKTIKIYIVTYGTLSADYDSKHFFFEDKALEFASDIEAHLTTSEREDHEIYVEGYEIHLPDEYTVTTAKQLDLDLSNNDVESPDYDILCGRFTVNPTFYKSIL